MISYILYAFLKYTIFEKSIYQLITLNPIAINKILVIDNHPGNLKIIEAMLKNIASRFKACLAWGKGNELAKKEQPAAILMDISKPINKELLIEKIGSLVSGE